MSLRSMGSTSSGGTSSGHDLLGVTAEDVAAPGILYSQFDLYVAILARWRASVLSNRCGSDSSSS
jgi:hypothetical protein